MGPSMDGGDGPAGSWTNRGQMGSRSSGGHEGAGGRREERQTAAGLGAGGGARTGQEKEAGKKMSPIPTTRGKNPNRKKSKSSSGVSAPYRLIHFELSMSQLS
jgi:hypothetical protein